MANLLLAFLLILNLNPIKINAIQSKIENFYINKYIDIKTESGEQGKITNFNISMVPIKNTNEKSIIAPKEYLTLDLNSGTTLEESNSDQKVQIASLTKMMTAYIVLKEMDLDKVITVPNLNSQFDDSVVGLQAGQTLTVREALKGLLIKSGSDAAQTLAIANAGSTDAFVAKMNQAATDLKLTNTHYSNPVGWDDKENFSTAKDVSSLARIILRNKTIDEIVKTKEGSLVLTSGESFQLKNTNLLLDDRFMGVKTGYTFGAGECLASLYVKDDKELLTVVLGSNDRFGETRQLIDWIFTHYSW